MLPCSLISREYSLERSSPDKKALGMRFLNDSSLLFNAKCCGLSDAFQPNSLSCQAF